MTVFLQHPGQLSSVLLSNKACFLLCLRLKPIVTAFLELIFVEIVKNEGKPDEFEKVRLILQSFIHKHHSILTHSDTFQQSSRRLLLCLYSMDVDLVFFTRHVSHSCVQADTVVQREIYIHSPSVLNFAMKTLLRVDKPLYRMPKAGVHWFHTYHNHHRDVLDLRSLILDTCLLFTPHRFSEDIDDLQSVSWVHLSSN